MKHLIIGRNLYPNGKPTSDALLKEIKECRADKVVLHLSEYFYDDWKDAIDSACQIARNALINVELNIKSRKDCDETIKQRNGSSDGRVSDSVINDALRNF